MKRIKLGKTEIDQETFECWIAEMGSSQYRANQYELFKHNCNNFSEDVAQFLGNGSQLKNPDISGALYTLRIQYQYTQCEDGARDVVLL